MEDIHNQSIMYKGKRTKRLRPLSPISYALPTNNSEQQQQQQLFPTSSLEFGSEATEEEEDMANCLILLAQGHFSNPLPRQVEAVEDHGYKYSSRRYMPAADNAGAGKAGYYVYQCKTCDRTFSSFQALGGHRASHKKPKGAAGEEQQKRQRHHEEEGQFMGMGSSLSLQLTNNNNNNSKVGNGNKVHECSMCGAEFTSGQALGGHMRRHRGTISATALTLTPADYSGSGEQQQQPIGINNNKKAVSLDLDLNLPAPPEDQQQQQQQPNFIFAASDQQKPPLLLSASALVDCHY